METRKTRLRSVAEPVTLGVVVLTVLLIAGARRVVTDFKGMVLSVAVAINLALIFAMLMLGY